MYAALSALSGGLLFLRLLSRGFSGSHLAIGTCPNQIALQGLALSFSAFKTLLYSSLQTTQNKAESHLQTALYAVRIYVRTVQITQRSLWPALCSDLHIGSVHPRPHTLALVLTKMDWTQLQQAIRLGQTLKC